MVVLVYDLITIPIQVFYFEVIGGGFESRVFSEMATMTACGV